MSMPESTTIIESASPRTGRCAADAPRAAIPAFSTCGASSNADRLPRRAGGALKVLAVAAALLPFLAGCGGGAGDGGDQAAGPPSTSISGLAMVGPVAGATVTAYELSADGSNGRSLGTATTDSTGAFRVVLSSPVPGAVRLAVSGGSYTNLANAAIPAAGVALSVIVPSVSSADISGVAITPLTSFADSRSRALLAAGTPLASALSQADSAIRLTYGIQDAAVPLYNLLPNFSLASGNAAILALLLGAFDQLAILQGRTPAEIYRAIIEDIADGTLDGRSAGGPVLFGPASPVPSNLATAAYLAALAAYVAPSNTTTVLARNGVTPSPATLSSVQGGVATQLQASWVQGGNNSALLSGAPVGTGTAAVSALRKRIGVNLLQPYGALAFGDAYATRSSATSDAAYIVLPVTNVGTKPLCFIKLANLGYRAADGTAISSGGLTFVQGSVRKLSASSISTDTCLAPAESGVVADIRTGVNFTPVATMEFSIEATEGGSVETAARVIPQSYSVRTLTGASQAISVALKNTGNASARVSSLSNIWVLFDDAMTPLHWGFANDAVSPATPLLPNAAGSISSNLVLYAGSGRRLLVFVDFDDGSVASPSADTVCQAEGLREDSDACKQALRTSRLSSQFNEARRAQAASALDDAATASTQPKGH